MISPALKLRPTNSGLGSYSSRDITERKLVLIIGTFNRMLIIYGVTADKGEGAKEALLTTLCCYSFEKVSSNLLIWSLQGFYKDYSLVWLRFLRVEALDSKGHCRHCLQM